MIDFPELVLENILKFLDTDVCCKNFNELSIIVTNKYFNTFYTRHFKYTFHNEFVKTRFPYKNKKILTTSIDRIEGKLCCRCARLDTLEKDRLENLLCRYSSMAHETHTNKLFDIYDYKTTYKEELSMLNIHFDLRVALTNFIIKMDKINSNLWFDPSRCCGGAGCNVEIII